MLYLLKHVFQDFFEDDCPRMAAALAYYTVFSLPPLLVLILLLLGTLWAPHEVAAAILGQAEALLGPSAAAEVRTVLANLERPGGGGTFGTVFGLGALAFGATGAFAQLQAALNRSWEVAPDPELGGVRAFLLKRVFSFAMVLAVAFLLLVSLVLSAVLSALGGAAAASLPGGWTATLLRLLDPLVSFAVIALLFGAIYKVVPDAVIAWRDVGVGAVATALLFVLGKLGIGVYLGRGDPGEAYGSAGSLVVILIWVYYSALVLLLGAEFTQAWATRHGEGVRPEPGASRLVEVRRRLRGGEAETPGE